jgi:hypothetical protein
LRVEELAHHIGRGKAEVEMSPAKCHLEYEARRQRIKLDQEQGKLFVDKLITNTQAGDLRNVFEWIQKNHEGSLTRKPAGLLW